MADEGAGGRSDAPRTDEVEGGLRFLHVLGMQGRLAADDAAVRLEALVEELVAQGMVDLRSFEARQARVRQRNVEREGQVLVHVAPAADKYALTDLPRIDC